MNERETLFIDDNGHLSIGGCDTVELANRFGTPLYVFDEQYIRNMMRIYRDTIASQYNGYGKVLYASKAFSCQAIYKIAEQENIGVDVVSGGELYTALSVGFPAQDIYLHGNNKLPYELEEAVEAGVGGIIVDSYLEADRLDQIAQNHNKIQPVLIRVNPGVEAHTHAYVQTAKPDSKFGFAIANGTALEMTQYLLTKKNLKLVGYHCHIGSQIFEKQSFVLAVQKMMDFMLDVKDKTTFEAEVLNIGGGFGVYYTDEDPKLKMQDYAEYLTTMLTAIKQKAQENNLKLPYILMEPGRSIVGEAGITLYKAGAIKDIPTVRKYVAIDGGMFDNPRYALYQSKYTIMLANRANEKSTEQVSIAGKCCESGDLIAVNVPLPEVKTGDIVAVLTTGAYNYSMASNYNRNFIPQAILVKDGNARVIVKKQTYQDLVRNDVVPGDL